MPSPTLVTFPGAGLPELGNETEYESLVVPSGDLPVEMKVFHKFTSTAIGNSFPFTVVLLNPVTFEVCKKAAVAVAVTFQVGYPSTLPKNRGTGVLAVLSRRSVTCTAFGNGSP